MAIWRKETATVAVVDTLNDGNWWYGYDLMRATRVRAGLMYRVLHDLETSGAVRAKWQDEPTPGRPRRRLYALTSS